MLGPCFIPGPQSVVRNPWSAIRGPQSVVHGFILTVTGIVSQSLFDKNDLEDNNKNYSLTLKTVLQVPVPIK